jgi:sugar/nucleoside kinase (ribokinase family)
MRSAAAAAITLTRAAGGRVSFDANYRPALWSEPAEAAARITALLPQVDLLKTNEAELALLTGERDLERGSGRLLELGARACAITLGRQGSYFRVAGGTGFSPAFAVETVDATGCGDAFVAGLLSRLIARGWPDRLTAAVTEEAMVYGNAAGALAATVQGAIPSLPSAEAVDHFLAPQAG